MRMNAQEFHLAQVNVARMIAPLDHPSMKSFVDQLPYINALADASPGFVWRLQTEDGDATAIRAFGDPLILFNMSVWQSLDALYDYAYRSDHLKPLRNRRAWFEKLEGAPLALWWVPAGHRPTVAEARERLDLLNRVGPSPEAFTFRQAFTAAGEPYARTSESEWAHG
jgi:hypothetical protein